MNVVIWDNRIVATGKEENMSNVYGIDIGTSNFKCAVKKKIQY